MNGTSTPWRRIVRLLRPRANRAQAIVALLCGLLGFALVLQVRSSGADPVLRNARQDDLVRILDDLTARSDRLRDEIDSLRVTEQRLAGGAGSSQAALEETRRRAQELGILAGTLPAHGPGATVTIRDPRGQVRADVVLDAVEELRDAGAEALQLDGAGNRSVRIVASTYLLDGAGGGLSVDGSAVRPPYQLVALGDGPTLAAAMRIPGGVVDTVAARPGASAVVTTSTALSVTALHRVSPPRYARPAPSSTGRG